MTDDAACPGCGAAKSSWTLVADATRPLKVGGRAKLEARRGSSDEAVVASDPRAYRFETAPTEVCPVLAKAVAARLQAEGRVPAPAHRLVARLKPRGGQERRLELAVDYAREAEAVVGVGADLPVDTQGAYDAHFVCVFGPAGEPLAFPGITVVDVSEEEGFAPAVELRGLSLVRELRTEHVGAAPSVAAPAVGDARPAVHLIEMEDVCFHTGSAVLLPGGPEDAEQSGALGLAAIRTALDFAGQFPEWRLLVAGHTDSVGSKSFNRALSLDRARNAAALLRGDRDAWVDLAVERHVVKDWQLILTWLAGRRGWSCDPLGVDGAVGDDSRTALKNFRAAYEAETGASLPRSQKVERADWEAFFDCYEHELARQLGCERAELPSRRAAVTFAPTPAVGCGEAWPVGGPYLDDHEAVSDRRVELLFFEEAELPALSCHAGGGACDPAACDLYGAGRYRAKRLPSAVDDFVPEDKAVIELPLWEPSGDPIAGVTVTVTAPGGWRREVVSDADGMVAALLPKPLPPEVTLTWERGGARSKTYYFEQPDALEEARQRALNNLFFDCPGLRAELLEALAHEESLAPLGVDAIRKATELMVKNIEEDA